MTTIDALMRSVPVIPVLVVEEVAQAEPIARALVAGGLTALEVTLRTPAALDVIRAMSRVEGAVVGAGTVLNARDLDAALEAGAQFIVSPGLTDPLTRAALARGVPYLPGVANAADIMRTEGAGWSLWAGPILPDRRHLRSNRPGLARPEACALRRWKLGRSAGRSGAGSHPALGRSGPSPAGRLTISRPVDAPEACA
jgi:hypothetical protein